MNTPQDVEQLQQLLSTHRRNLAHLLTSAAAHGGEKLAPVSVVNGIHEARVEIRYVKTALRRNGIEVEDWPTDEPNHERVLYGSTVLTSAVNIRRRLLFFTIVGICAIIFGIFIFLRLKSSTVDEVLTSENGLQQANTWTISAYDTFDSANNGWTIGAFGDENFQQEVIINNFLNWKIFGKRTNIGYNLSSLVAGGDYFVKVDVEHINGDGSNCAGIITQATADSFYMFCITPDQRYTLLSIEELQIKTAIPLTHSNSIEKLKPNTILMIANSNQMLLYINYNYVGSYAHRQTASGKFGLGINTQQINNNIEYRFDNLEIRVPK